MPAKRIPTTGADGRRHFVEVAAELALALDTFDRNLRRRDALFRKHHRIRAEPGSMARKGRRRNGKALPPLVGYLNIELEPAFKAVYPRAEASPWEGPRHSFTRLIGESVIWPPPGASIDPETGGVLRKEGNHDVCALCGGRRLKPHEVCLGCDRSGRD